MNTNETLLKKLRPLALLGCRLVEDRTIYFRLEYDLVHSRACKTNSLKSVEMI